MTRRELAAYVYGVISTASVMEAGPRYNMMGKLCDLLWKHGILTGMHVGSSDADYTQEDIKIEWLLGQVKNGFTNSSYLGFEFIEGQLQELLALTPAERVLSESLKGLKITR
jgi:hypothetical protein